MMNILSNLFKVYQFSSSFVKYLIFAMILSSLNVQGCDLIKKYNDYLKEKKRREDAEIIDEAFKRAYKEALEQIAKESKEDYERYLERMHQREEAEKLKNEKSSNEKSTEKPSRINPDYLKDNSQKRLDKIDEILRNQSLRRMREK